MATYTRKQAATIREAFDKADYACDVVDMSLPPRWRDACKALKRDHGDVWRAFAVDAFARGFKDACGDASDRVSLKEICTYSAGYIMAVMCGARCGSVSTVRDYLLEQDFVTLARDAEAAHMAARVGTAAD